MGDFVRCDPPDRTMPLFDIPPALPQTITTDWQGGPFPGIRGVKLTPMESGSSGLFNRNLFLADLPKEFLDHNNGTLLRFRVDGFDANGVTITVLEYNVAETGATNAAFICPVM